MKVDTTSSKKTNYERYLFKFNLIALLYIIATTLLIIKSLVHTNPMKQNYDKLYRYWNGYKILQRNYVLFIPD